MWLVRERERDEEMRRQEKEQELQERTERELGGRQIPEPLREKFDITICNRMLHSKILRGVIIMLAVAVFVPVLVFLFLDMDTNVSERTQTCVVYSEYRIPCGPKNISANACWDINCCFDTGTKTCYHYLPSKYLYKAVGDSEEIDYLVPITDNTPFGGTNKPKVYLTITPESKDKLSISLHEQVAKKVIRRVYANEDNEYNVTVYTKEMGVEVRRISTGDVLLTTSRGPTIVSDRYWEWTVDLESEHLYGIDFLRAKENETITRIIYKNAENHTSVPKFMAYRDGKYYGLEIEHEGPLEITVLPSRLIVLRLLAGNYLTLHLSTGPSPTDVLKQQRRVDYKLPPYWALGVHICRDGRFTSLGKFLKEFREFVDNSKTIPYDSDCVHENIFSLTMDWNEKELNAIINAVDKVKKKFMMSLAPQILLDSAINEEAQKLGILYDGPGKYLGKNVTYPDYKLNSEEKRKWFTDSFNALPWKPDGFVLRDNWAVNENYTENSTKVFQYMTENIRNTLSNTLPWNSTIDKTEHILRHNSYGHDHAVAISEMNPELVLTASYMAGTPGFAHEQNVNISWVNFKLMLTKTLSHSLFGGALYSTPVCGSTSFYSEETHEALCMRWYLAAATMPMFRISSEEPRRDPSSFKSKTLRNIAIEAIEKRYTLLPYYYTILSDKMPLVRPMFFNYPNDKDVFDLDEQYMLGDALLVVQPVFFRIPTLKFYLPEHDGGWYEFWGGMQYLEKGWIEIPVVETELVTFIAAGNIVPLQNSVSDTAEDSRLKPLKLAVALNCTNNKAPCKASGKLYTRDSSILVFNADEHSLQISHNDPGASQLSSPPTIAVLKVYGLPGHTDQAIHINCDDNVNNTCKIDSTYHRIMYTVT